MTDYDKLAQRIVALGIGEPVRSTLGHPVRYRIASDRINGTFTAEQFCNDGRVVGALIEKCWARGLDIHIGDSYTEVLDNKYGLHWVGEHGNKKEKWLVAIAEACCDALEATDE